MSVQDPGRWLPFGSSSGPGPLRTTAWVSGRGHSRRALASRGGDRPTGGGDQHEPAALSRKPRALRDLPAAAGPGRGSRRRLSDRPRRIAPVSWVGSKPRIACVASSSPPARAAQADLAARYDLVDPGDCDVIVALGGDGLLLHTIHEHLQLARPIFGMNRGTVGFLMTSTGPTACWNALARPPRSPFTRCGWQRPTPTGAGRTPLPSTRSP
jgi:ATP-NAD kinase N-terminal domain